MLGAWISRALRAKRCVRERPTRSPRIGRFCANELPRGDDRLPIRRRVAADFGFVARAKEAVERKRLGCSAEHHGTAALVAAHARAAPGARLQRAEEGADAEQAAHLDGLARSF